MNLFFEIDNEQFLADVTVDKLQYKGVTFPVHLVPPYDPANPKVLYRDRRTGAEELVRTPHSQTAFYFSLCWRGCWEGRLYFEEREYWGEDLPVYHQLWQQLEACLRAHLRAAHPDRTFED